MSSKQKNKQPMTFKSLIPRYIFILIFNLLVIAIMLFFISSYSKINTVSVTGNQMVYDQDIINMSQVKKGDSLLEIYRDLDNIEKKITKKITQVSNSKVKIVNVNNLQIEIEEYTTVAYLSTDGIYLRVLENGVILEQKYTVSLGNQPILSNFEEGKTLNLLIKELEQLDKSILNLISEIELDTKDSNPLFIKVYMNNGNQVLTSIPSFSEKIPYYPEMVQAVDGQKGVFDMEAGVYFIPFTNKENEEDGINENEQKNVEEAVN